MGLVKLARVRGIYVIVCDGYENGPAKLIADKAYTIDIRNVDEIAKMCVMERVDGIVGSFSDLIFEQITKIAEKAKLRWYVTSEMLPYYREKSCMKELLEKIGVRIPRNKELLPDFSDAELERFHFPVVIKPLDGYGSKGIRVADSVEEVKKLYGETLGQSCWDRRSILMEEYSQGREYNIMSWLVDGEVYPICLGDREKNPRVGPSIPKLTRVVYPAKAYCKVIDEAVGVLQKFADATGQREGPLCMQFFYTPEGVEVCEIAGRMFGYEESFIEDCSGLSVEGLLLDYVYNTSRLRDTMKSHNPFFEGHYASLYFLGEEGKQIKDISACRRLGEDPHVMQSRIFYHEGETINDQGGRPYLARYYLRAPSYEELDEVTEYFFDQMHVEAFDGSEASVKFTLQTDECLEGVK